MKKKIIYVSTSRSDFGISKNLLVKLEKSKNIDLNIIVSGTHVIDKFGMSIDEISKYKFKKINSLKVNSKLIDKPSDYIIKLSRAYLNAISKIKPHLIILLGDRYEIAQVALLTHLNNIPIIHIHGGEKTTGSKDDNYRHVISKLSQLHFVAHKEFKKRLIQLGEDNKNIYNIGSLSLENIENHNQNLYQMNKKFNFLNLKKNFFLITFHPCFNISQTKKEINVILDVIIRNRQNNYVLTYPNQDEGFDIIIKKIENLNSNYPHIYLYKNLGRENFMYLLKKSSGIIGNSSSGIIEAPYFKVPTINIGTRQHGRLHSSTIFNIPAKNEDLENLIKKISNKNFKLNTKKIFYKRKKFSSDHILKIILDTNFKNFSLNKNFRDYN